MEFKAGQTHEIDAFLAAPDPQTAVVLIFGPNEGLVRERADKICDAIVPDRHDPFRRAVFAAEALSSDPARLAAEAAAQSLTGGRRVIRVRGAGNDIAAKIRPILASPEVGGLIVLETGELRKGALRTICSTKDARAVIIPCFEEAERELRTLIKATLEAEKLRIASDASAYLIRHLGGDRSLVRAELEKLVLYATADEGNGGPITLANVEACIGDNAALNLDALAYAAYAGDRAATERWLGRVTASGAPPITILRTLQRHSQRLQIAIALVAAGTAIAEVAKAMRPPIFWRDAKIFTTAVQLWSRAPNLLDRAVTRLTEAELACKRSGVPDQPVCAKMLMDIALVAHRQQQHGSADDP